MLQVEETIPGSNSNITECLSAVPYPTEGGLCQAVLEDTLLSVNCDSGGTPLVLRDQETSARLLISALNQLSPSPECITEVIPLLCVHLFGLCDSSGVSIQPTSGQCQNVRDNLCSLEWQTAVSLMLDLPDCDSFPEEQVSCPESSPGSNGKNSLGCGVLFWLP